MNMTLEAKTLLLWCAWLCAVAAVGYLAGELYAARQMRKQAERAAAEDLTQRDQWAEDYQARNKGAA